MPLPGRLLLLLLSRPAVGWLAAAGCRDVAPGRLPAGCCEAAAPAILHSRVDDDDGDGDPRDEDYPRIDDEDDDIADHAWIRDRDGRFHLFFQNEDHGGGTTIQHYVSTDLRSLEFVGVALRPDPQGWDSYALWAPHVVERDGTYYMFYTGTTGRDANAVQRIGVATSHDLTTWVRARVHGCPGAAGDGCVYQCDECWTTWSGPAGAYNQQCRDPFVTWDAASRRWVLFATARSVDLSGVVTVASSPDLLHWRGRGFLGATRRLAAGVGAQTTGGEAENPCLLQRDGRWILLFSDWRDPEDAWTANDPRTIVQWVASASLAADSTGSPNWVYGGPIPDPGVNAVEAQEVEPGRWILSESISNENCADYDAHRRELRLRCVDWLDGVRFDLRNYAPGRCTDAGPSASRRRGLESPSPLSP
jgi:hypothetical protein